MTNQTKISTGLYSEVDVKKNRIITLKWFPRMIPRCHLGFMTVSLLILIVVPALIILKGAPTPIVIIAILAVLGFGFMLYIGIAEHLNKTILKILPNILIVKSESLPYPFYSGNFSIKRKEIASLTIEQSTITKSMSNGSQQQYIRKTCYSVNIIHQNGNQHSIIKRLRSADFAEQVKTLLEFELGLIDEIPLQNPSIMNSAIMNWAKLVIPALIAFAIGAYGLFKVLGIEEITNLFKSLIK